MECECAESKAHCGSGTNNSLTAPGINLFSLLASEPKALTSFHEGNGACRLISVPNSTTTMGPQAHRASAARRNRDGGRNKWTYSIPASIRFPGKKLIISRLWPWPLAHRALRRRKPNLVGSAAAVVGPPRWRCGKMGVGSLSSGQRGALWPPPLSEGPSRRWRLRLSAKTASRKARNNRLFIKARPDHVSRRSRLLRKDRLGRH